jgi:hypothetical protein
MWLPSVSAIWRQMVIPDDGASDVGLAGGPPLSGGGAIDTL